MNKLRLIMVLTLNRAPIASLVLLVSLLSTGTQVRSATLPVECGSVITHDIKLENDVGPCLGDGLIVAVSGIAINLNGHKIFATQRANVGLRLQNVSNVTVTRGTVDGFDAGVLIVGGLANTVSYMTVQNNRFGIQVEHAESSGHSIAKNIATTNRLIGILLGPLVSGATINKNISSGNAGYGIVVADGSTSNVIEGNETFDNGDVGLALLQSDTGFTNINLVPPILDVVWPDRLPYIAGTDYRVMGVSGSGDLSAARLVPINIALGPSATSLTNPNPADTSTSGCDSADFSAAGFQPGDVALIQRGTCNLAVKISNAGFSGASGVVIFNEGQAPDRITSDFGGTVALTGVPFANFPVLSAAYAVGLDLYNLTRAGTVTIRVFTNVQFGGFVSNGTPATQNNVINKNSGSTAIDDSSNCGWNQWIKNNFGQLVCGAGTGGGTGATSHSY